MTAPTYADLIQAGSERLRQSGLGAPVRESRLLMQLVSDLSSAALIAAEHEPASAAHRQRFEQALEKRCARQPLAHIAGSTDFFGLRLRSDARALVPRTDSECVIELALQHMPEQAPFRIADLGTGSGALLAALLSERPRSRGIAVEQSQDALSLAAENFEQTGMADRVQLFLGSWDDWTGWDVCDLIIANPPYIRTDILPTLAPEVREHDPLEALDGGADGLDAYRDIVARAAAGMRSGGWLVLEIGYDQKQAVSDLLSAASFANLQHKQDLGGHDRAIAATKT